MNKRTQEEEAKYQEKLTQADMRRAFWVLRDLMIARDIEYPPAVIWQTHDENGNPNYFVMHTDSWDMDHTNKAHIPPEIVNDHIEQAA